MANLLDKLVGWLNPRAGLLRHHHRSQLKRAYEAASPRDGWRPKRAGASANADHAADGATLRAKARALVQNVPYIEAGLDGKVSATIGTGIVPRATGKQADKINAALAVWFKECDADGRLDFFGMQAASDRAMEQDGEVLIRLRPRRLTDGLAIPLQLQLLEIDWIDSSRIGTIGGYDVVNGIAYDGLGKVAGYWLWDYHPGDINVRRNVRTQSSFVAARNIIHLFEQKRPSQGRGFTSLAPVITRVRDLQLYEDAELARKNLETRLSALVSPDPTVFANPAADGLTATPSQIQATGSLGELASGAITAVPVGTTIEMVEPKPAGGYAEYIKLQLHLIAAGFGCTYEMLTGDVSEVNFSSARVRLLDFRRSIDQKRWLTIIPRMLDPIYRAAIDAGELAGLWAADYAVDYSVPKWDYVNPEQDVKADIAEISVGLSTVSEKLRMRGYKPEQVFAEIKAERDQFESLGVLDWLLFKEKGRLPGDPATAADASAAADKRATEQRAADAVRWVEYVADADRRADQRRLAEFEQRSTDAKQHREALAAIASQSHVINVAPPQINVAPPSVEIGPTTIHVERAADAPPPIGEPFTIEKDVTRDEATGLISKVVERRVIN